MTTEEEEMGSVALQTTAEIEEAAAAVDMMTAGGRRQDVWVNHGHMGPVQHEDLLQQHNAPARKGNGWAPCGCFGASVSRYIGATGNVHGVAKCAVAVI